MPSFQNLVAQVGQKRKSEEFDANSENRKKVALGREVINERNGGHSEQYWMVQWRAPQYKKHKTWDGDGVLVVNGFKASLYDLEGKLLTMGKAWEGNIGEGAEFSCGNKDLEVDHLISRTDYLSGACFGRGVATQATPSGSALPRTLVKQFIPLKPIPLNSSITTSLGSRSTTRHMDLEPVGIFSPSDKRGSAKDYIWPKNSHWTANWRKPQYKKHKTFDGDAFVSHVGSKLTLISEEGKVMGSTGWDSLPLQSGYLTRIAGREVRLDSEISAARLPAMTGTMREPSIEPIDFEDADPPIRSTFLQGELNELKSLGSPVIVNSPSTTKKFVAPVSFYGKGPEKPKPKSPLHDPDAEGAVVMMAPTKEHQSRFNKKNLPVVSVVIDPVIGRRLRPHQQEGVKFLYESVMGLRKHEGQGCILADEMGLGKTLQTIALIWTLLRQNPYTGAGPIVGKALIACPVSLVNNWKHEFHKWLGKDRIGIFVGDKNKTQIKQFINSKIHHVLIIGYERLRTVIDDLAYCTPQIGLIVCDEGHRLKSADSKCSKMFEALRTPRRIILSGTPIQNDLGEFHAMADFCNPGLLDDYSTFRRVFETPILKSRAPGSSAKEIEVGEARSLQLQTISRSFVLRRDAAILKNYLPPKYEYVVFVTPTPLQLSIFSKVLQGDMLSSVMHGSTAKSLALINMLTKISNSPVLLKASTEKTQNDAKKGKESVTATAVEQALKLLPEKTQIDDFSLSGKLTALAKILRAIRKHTEEKCIIVSHFTSTLNIIEAFCQKSSYTYHRLDGQTPMGKRQEYVDSFNKSTQSSRFIFLLSAKAGGIGLNLIGASRLCLIDSDWNPSHDLQSMARIHRDGQKRPVFIYRLLTTGAIDEKIYQRQVIKMGLSDSLMGTDAAEGSRSKSDSFSNKDLRDLFTVHPRTACHTHDLLECPCNELGSSPSENENADAPPVITYGSDVDDDEEDENLKVGFMVASQVKQDTVDKTDRMYMKKKKAQLAALGQWNHINCLRPEARENVHDDILRKLLPQHEGISMEGSARTERKSRIDALLDAVDLENVLALEEEEGLCAEEVPGGTISFLFERGSKSAL